jgi:hypothetical protein
VRLRHACIIAHPTADATNAEAASVEIAGALEGFGDAVVSVAEIVAWHRKQGQVRAEPIEAAVSKLRRQGRGEDAIRLAREYPDLPASRKVLVNREDGPDARGTKGGKCGR